MTARFEDRTMVEARSQSATQHSLVILFDGVPVISVNNTKPSLPFPDLSQERRPMTYRDHMLMTPEEAAPALKIFFLQRQMRFTNGPIDYFFEQRFDALSASMRMRSSAFLEPVQSVTPTDSTPAEEEVVPERDRQRA